MKKEPSQMQVEEESIKESNSVIAPSGAAAAAPRILQI